MNEIIESLAALLERGIIVEPYGENWTKGGPAFRVRLDDSEEAADDEQPQQRQGMGW